MDLAVSKDPLVRLARAPYTMNMKTRLYAVHVDDGDTMEDIIRRSEAPTVRNSHLLKILHRSIRGSKEIDDKIEKQRKARIVKKVTNLRMQETEDIRGPIKEILGTSTETKNTYSIIVFSMMIRTLLYDIPHILEVLRLWGPW